jgi:phospholipid transport system substrate-binding protein
MLTKQGLPPVVSIQNTGLCRRSFLGLALAASAAPFVASQASAAADVAGAVTAIQQFNQALIGAMKAGKQSDFRARYARLAPAVDRAFDLETVLTTSIGARWASISPEDQKRLLDAFQRYTVASYVANFSSYDGQVFSVASETRDIGEGRMVVQARISPVHGDAIPLGYVMKETPVGWKIVDVLADGSISRVAVQRSDFRGVLASGGGNALAKSLQRKISDLSGGAFA